MWQRGGSKSWQQLPSTNNSVSQLQLHYRRINYMQVSNTWQLADNTAATRVVWWRVRRTNNTMFLGTITRAATDDWWRRCAAMQEAGSDEWRRARAAGRQQIRLQVCFQRCWQRQLINAVYCSTRRNCPTAKFLQWQHWSHSTYNNNNNNNNNGFV